MSYVFISYARQDVEDVDRLSRSLQRRGIEVWIDRHQIRPGERWENAISKAVENGAFFLACFSKHTIAKKQTYMIKELNLATNVMRRISPRHTWLIPLRFSECEVPGTFKALQWIDMFPDWESGLDQLISVISAQEQKIPPRPPYLNDDIGSVFKKLEYQVSERFDRVEKMLSDINNKNDYSAVSINPPWAGRDFNQDKNHCFVLMPFSE